jgi:hypothetical protein
MYPETVSLEAYVDTNLRAFTSLITRESVTTVAIDNKMTAKATVVGFSGAVYLRNGRVELLRYNPNYPRQGMRTVILRGRE